MQREFEKNALDVRFFDALRPEGDVTLRPDYDAKAMRKLYGRKLIPGEAGCYLSHVAVWQELIASSDEAWCVMEDDIVFKPGFQAAAEELFSLREHWDCVRLLGLLKHKQTPCAVLPSGMRLMWMSTPPLGLQCYLLTRKAALALTKKAKIIRHPIDHVVDRQWEHGLRLYLTDPEFAEPNEAQSTIGDRSAHMTRGEFLARWLYQRRDKLRKFFFKLARKPRRVLRLVKHSE
jgi:glycosyl transferase family 25